MGVLQESTTPTVKGLTLENGLVQEDKQKNENLCVTESESSAKKEKKDKTKKKKDKEKKLKKKDKKNKKDKKKKKKKVLDDSNAVVEQNNDSKKTKKKSKKDKEKKKKRKRSSETTDAVLVKAKKVKAIDSKKNNEETKEPETEDNLNNLNGIKKEKPFEKFEDTPFDVSVLKALKDAGFEAPTTIQQEAWPYALKGKDVVAVSKTGSGKTLGFLLPIVHMIKNTNKSMGKQGPHALVLAPTRELALQIEIECQKFANHISCVCIYGGVPRHPQIGALKKKPSIIIATPGRMNDMINSKATDLSKVVFVVMDEADRMLDMGFEPQIKECLKTVSPEHQTFFFSATWPPKVHKMADKYLKKERAHINVGDTEELSANKSIKQVFHELDDSEKDMALWKIVQELPKDAKLLTFANTKRRIDYLANACWAEGFGASAIHGGKTQQERNEALDNFATGKWPLMFATDVCARGLDIKGITHVLNFDMPRDVDNYIHRIGRTGRAGRSGHAITFWNKQYDQQCAAALAKIAREAGQEVPSWLEKWAMKAKKAKGWNY